MKSLRDLKDTFGDRKAAIGREMTKLNEEFIRGNLSDLIASFNERKPKGEFVILIEGNKN